MLSKILFRLSKKISRKNLKIFINQSFKTIAQNQKDYFVLNIGSGGDLENIIKNYFRQVFSIDIEENRKPDQVLDICDEHFQAKIKFKPNIICCFEVLEHTKDPKKAMQNIYDILGHGDKVFLSVPFNFHIHDEPHDYFRFTYYGLKLLFSEFKKVEIKKRNGWLESIFVNIIRLEKEKNIFSKVLGKTFILVYFLLFPLIIIIQKIFPSEKLTTGYYVEAQK